MTAPEASAAIRGSERTAAEIVHAWRRLLPSPSGAKRGGDQERRTLVACSGGADSSGLLLALASRVSRAAEILVVGHVVHDLRPAAESLGDRDAAAELAGRLGLAFVEESVRVLPEGGNAEGAARRLRYQALARMAAASGCGAVATAHHADDQLETLLLALVRGSGPAGLAGVSQSRELAPGVCLVRPALHVGRDDLRELCRRAEWEWREDATNADTDRARAAIRHGVIPQLKALRPSVERRASRSARLLAGTAEVVRAAAIGLLAQAERTDMGLSLSRGVLKAAPEVVVGAMLRLASAQLRCGSGRDRLGGMQLDPLIRAIRDGSGETRVHSLGGVHVVVGRSMVDIRRHP